MISKLRQKALDKINEIEEKTAELKTAISNNLIPCCLTTNLEDMACQLTDIVLEMESEDVDQFMSKSE